MGAWFEKITYGELVNRAATRYGDKEFMVFAGQRWSFRQVRAEIDRTARGLWRWEFSRVTRWRYGW